MRTVAMAAGRAAEVKAELLDCADDMVRERSSTFVLGVAGIAPDNGSSVNINFEIKAGRVIDLTDQPPRGVPRLTGRSLVKTGWRVSLDQNFINLVLHLAKNCIFAQEGHPTALAVRRAGRAFWQDALMDQ